jgi:hypothetical protein
MVWKEGNIKTAQEGVIILILIAWHLVLLRHF